MKCPNCKENNLSLFYERGIEFDICPNCNEVWLDGGKISFFVNRFINVKKEFFEYIKHNTLSKKIHPLTGNYMLEIKLQDIGIAFGYSPSCGGISINYEDLKKMVIYLKDKHKAMPKENVVLSKENLEEKTLHYKNIYFLFILLGGSFVVGYLIYFLSTKYWLFNWMFIQTLFALFTYEVGRAIIGFMFGSVLIPAFSPWGGGLALPVFETILIPIFVIIGIIYLIIIFRKEKHEIFIGDITISEKFIVPAGVIAILIYSTFAFTPLKDISIYAGGHIFTAIIAGLLLSRGILEKNMIEKFIWAGLGWCLIIIDFAGFMRLKKDALFREDYITGALWDDFLVGDLEAIREILNIDFDLIVNLFILIAIILPFLTSIAVIFFISKVKGEQIKQYLLRH